jgi:predicted nucleic acid-binding protein
MISILDAGFLYALIDRTDIYNEPVVSALTQYRGQIVLPVIAITETAYLVKKNLGIESLASFSEFLSDSAYEFETPNSADLIRCAEILRKYNDSNIDFVDACIVAIAERLNITKILTVDHRHFRMFKPTHCKSFELIPEKL